MKDTSASTYKQQLDCFETVYVTLIEIRRTPDDMRFLFGRNFHLYTSACECKPSI